MIFYKVRYKETGKYWKGGGIKSHGANVIDTNDRKLIFKEAFSVNGKVWPKKRFVDAAIRSLRNTARSCNADEVLWQILRDKCEVLTLQSTVIESKDVFPKKIADIPIIYDLHPAGGEAGKLAYDDDDRTLILKCKGSQIIIPSLHECWAEDHGRYLGGSQVIYETSRGKITGVLFYKNDKEFGIQHHGGEILYPDLNELTLVT